VLARAHQSLIWARQRHVNALRSALREFYPGALAALGAQLAEPEALAVLELARLLARAAGLPGQRCGGRWSTRGDAGNLQTRVVAIHDALATPQLAAPEPVEAAYRHVIDGLVAVLRCLNKQVAALEEQLAARFAAHRDAVIVRSQPGLGVVLGARCWPSSATTLAAIRRPRAARPSPAPPRHPVLGLAHCGGRPGSLQSAAGGRLLPVGIRRLDRLPGGPALLGRPQGCRRLGHDASPWRGKLVGRLTTQFHKSKGAGDLARRHQRAAGPPLWHQAGVDHLADRPGGNHLAKAATSEGGIDQHRQVA